MTNPNTSNQLEQLPSIGERIDLPCGSILQTPHSETIAYLQGKDPRVRYYAADRALAAEQSRERAFTESVTDRLGAQIDADFGHENVVVRSAVASLTERFPFWPGQDGKSGKDMQTVLDILESGSDTGQDTTRVGFVVEGRGSTGMRLNDQTAEWLEGRMGNVMTELPDGDSQGDDVFPIVIVYKKDVLEGDPDHGWNKLTGPANERIAALYITDKIRATSKPDLSPPAVQRAAAGKALRQQVSFDELDDDI